MYQVKTKHAKANMFAEIWTLNRCLHTVYMKRGKMKLYSTTPSGYQQKLLYSTGQYKVFSTVANSGLINLIVLDAECFYFCRAQTNKPFIASDRSLSSTTFVSILNLSKGVGQNASQQAHPGKTTLLCITWLEAHERQLV
ncbi:hypothetical protein PFLUV_G00097430 [Perca fluviatilis]|uniref:Uncharacterized protein n=1 Tax=Perca fluviatilis TaxID=8168 RepID=A0A6A5FB50_PERFL|nr:hypothetical protein PFLUV_G00097430 [Perca fluviatilis]